jgi:hypothetical protein
MKFTKKTIYVGLFAILYLIVAFSSFFHACAFFGLANNTWMSIILAFAFEVGQAAVLFSLLTSTKDRGRIMPWVLMTMFTLVQVIGNVYSSYKYIITNSVENLRYFKEPIFIWTELPDAQANVIIVYLVGALLPIAALLLTSMITNYLTDQSEDNNKPLIDKENIDKIEEIKETAQELPQITEEFENPLINQNSILQMENQGLTESNKRKDDEIEQLKKQLEEAKNNEKLITQQELENAQKTKEDSQQRMSSTDVGLTPTEESKNDDIPQGESTSESQSDNDNGEQSMDTIEDKTETKDTTPENSEQEIDKIYTESNEGTATEIPEEPKIVEEIKKPSHFINL